MNARTTAGLMVLAPLVGLAAGCNAQRPTITFRLSPETSAQNQPLSDLGMPPPQLSATPSRWEYKVAKSPQGDEQELTKFLNEQGREGWEFVGQLQTKDSYLVLRRPKLPRDYIRSRGERNLPPDIPDDLPTGPFRPGTTSSRRATLPTTGKGPPPVKTDSRPSGSRRPDDGREE
jgi:hypothetical protein